RGSQARHRFRDDRRDRLEGGRTSRHLARPACHDSASVRHRSSAADLLPQRDPAAADERARRTRPRRAGIGRHCGPGTGRTMKLNHLNLTVRNASETRKFLEKYFGLQGELNPYTGEPTGLKDNPNFAILFDDSGLVLT